MTDPISVEGLPVGWTAHRGMLQSANFVLRQLESKEILKQTFMQYPNYHLVITGHSLGAGAAVLLSILLKPSYPKVRCFSFSPPGGLLSLAAARFTETFCMSVIIGDDLVPRLSLSTLDLLKRQMIAELEACRHPKVSLFPSIPPWLMMRKEFRLFQVSHISPWLLGGHFWKAQFLPATRNYSSTA